MLDGHERIERVVDRRSEGHAEIKRTVDVEVGAGEIDLVKPYEVHAEQTIGERTVAVIIRSQKAGTFNQGRYNPDTRVYFESLGPRQTPVEMLPAK